MLKCENFLGFAVCDDDEDLFFFFSLLYEDDIDDDDGFDDEVDFNDDNGDDGDDINDDDGDDDNGDNDDNDDDDNGNDDVEVTESDFDDGNGGNNDADDDDGKGDEGIAGCVDIMTLILAWHWDDNFEGLIELDFCFDFRDNDGDNGFLQYECVFRDLFGEIFAAGPGFTFEFNILA